MVCSIEERQAISRRNGAKSKGPKSHASKPRSSKNSIEHGFYAVVHNLADEDLAEVGALRERWFTDVGPRNVAEEFLTEQCFRAHLQSNRVERARHARLTQQEEARLHRATNEYQALFYKAHNALEAIRKREAAEAKEARKNADREDSRGFDGNEVHAWRADHSKSVGTTIVTAPAAAEPIAAPGESLPLVAPASVVEVPAEPEAGARNEPDPVLETRTSGGRQNEPVATEVLGDVPVAARREPAGAAEPLVRARHSAHRSAAARGKSRNESARGPCDDWGMPRRLRQLPGSPAECEEPRPWRLDPATARADPG